MTLIGITLGGREVHVLRRHRGESPVDYIAITEGIANQHHVLRLTVIDCEDLERLLYAARTTILATAESFE